MSRSSSTSLVARHLRSAVSTSIALALLVAIAVSVAGLLPRALVVLSDAELQHQLAELRPGYTDLYGTGQFGTLDNSGSATTAEQLFGPTDEVLAGVPSGLSSPLRDSLGAVSWVALIPPDLVNIAVPRVRVQPVIGLAVDLHWQDRVTFVEGTAPTAWSGDRAVPLPIAISRDYAEQAGFQIGDVIDYSEAPLVVSGIYDADDPDDPYWVHARELLSATVTNTPSSLTVVRGAAYVDPLSAAFLPVPLQRSELRAWYPIIADTMTYEEAPELTDQLRRLASLGLYLPTGEALVFESGLPTTLDRVTASISTVTALLALAASAPLGALLAVLTLGTRAILDRRRSTLVLASSRGASELQLRTTMLVEGLLVGLPLPALSLVAVALLMPVPVDASSYALPALIALAVPVLFAGSTPRQGRERSDLGAVGSRWRWIVELSVIGVAGLALFLLLRRGLVLTTDGGVDPLLAATPLLLSLAVCVVVLRLYPLPLLALQRAARAGRSAVGLVGATGSIRANTAGFGAVLAMVVGVSAAMFSLVLSSTVSAGLATAATVEAGADIRIDAANLDGIDEVRTLEGVRSVVGLDRVGGVEITFGLDRPHLTVVFADLAALHDVRPDIPAIPVGSILVSSDIASRATGDTTLNGVQVTMAGSLTSDALPGLIGSWVLADVSTEQAITGEATAFNTLLVATRAGADIAATASTIRDLVTADQRPADLDRVEVADRATLATDAASRPAAAGLDISLLAAAALSLLLCVIAVALGALGAAASRARTLGVLRLLGMSPAQLRGVLAWELAPVALTALVAGTAFGIGLAVLMVGLVDLRAIVGGTQPVAASIPWPLIAAAAAGFAFVVAATGALTALAARRLTASTAVKIGVE